MDNASRAQIGRNLVSTYINEVGDGECCLRDILADLMHMAAIDCECENFEEALAAARMRFNTEVADEAEGRCPHGAFLGGAGSCPDCAHHDD